MFDGGIIPKPLNVIKMPFLRQKDVHHNVEIVYQNPFRLFPALRMRRFDMELFIDTAHDIFTQGFGMRAGCGGADDESVEQGMLQRLLEIDRTQILCLLFLQGFQHNRLQSGIICLYTNLFFNSF